MEDKYLKAVYKLCLSLYPNRFHERFGDEMEFILEEMLKEKKNNDMLLVKSIINVAFCAMKENIEAFSLKEFVNTSVGSIEISKSNVFGVILMLPLFTAFFIDFISRLLDKNLSHPNYVVMNTLDHSFFYTKNVLFTWLFIFPLIAILLNIAPLINNYVINKKVSFVSLFIVLIALMFLAIIPLHDFAPCVVHHVRYFGLTGFSNTISVCKKA